MASLKFHAAFAGGRTPIHTALERFTKQCILLDIPFAVAGGLAVVANGDRERVTHDVDILITKPNLDKFKLHSLGKGWVDKFPGSKGMKDSLTNTPIDILLAGGIPGSGRPEDTPVRFPDPATEDDLILFGDAPHLSLKRLIELKLASGLTDPARLRDLVDVMTLIQVRDIDPSLSQFLDPSVRPKFLELWRLVDSKRGVEE